VSEALGLHQPKRKDRVVGLPLARDTPEIIGFMDLPKTLGRPYSAEI
jgi:hypothetical protein